MRNVISSLILKLSLAAVLVAVITMIYGVARFPAAPIRWRGDGYYDKAKNPQTEADFNQFNRWKLWLIGSFATAFLGFFVVVLCEKKPSRE